MPENLEYLEILHEMSTAVDTIIKGIDGYVAQVCEGEVTFPLANVAHMQSMLMIQQKFIKLLVEENESIKDTLESLVARHAPQK
jgi:hypothetical protein